MTEVIEQVCIGIIQEIESKCPFPHDKEEHDCKKSKDNKLEGDATILGENINNGKISTVVEGHPVVTDKTHGYPYKELDPDTNIPANKRVVYTFKRNPPFEYPAAFSAHHLIPAAASLKKAAQLVRFMSAGKTVCCDIGYDVNGRENGVWLPGLHAVNSKGINVWSCGNTKGAFPDKEGEGKGKIIKKKGQEYKDLNFARQVWHEQNPAWLYVKACMNFLNEHANDVEPPYEGGVRQFHDAHPAYSKEVLKKLQAIGAHLNLKAGGSKKTAAFACPKCTESKKNNKKLIPPYALLARLNVISKTLRGYVVKRDRHKILYTSSWCNAEERK